MIFTKSWAAVAATNAAMTVGYMIPATFLAAILPPELSVSAVFWGTCAGLCRSLVLAMKDSAGTWAALGSRMMSPRTFIVCAVGAITAAGLHGVHLPGLDSALLNLNEANHDFVKGGMAVLLWGFGEDYFRGMRPRR